ncbi:MAG: SDR family oxidoreductase [Bacteroidota bacterium]|nr:SDR family oxidoreductase [Bacteroidota bacterium]
MKALITGASKGIGRAISLSLVKEGIDVLIHSRSLEDLDQLKQELLDINTKVIVICVASDISKTQGVDLVFAELERNTFYPDILINNAGIFLQGTIKDEPEGQLQTLLDINLLSAYHLTRKIIPSMILKKAGYIFNICSVASLFAYSGGSSYGISKFALLGFSKYLREELKNEGIKVCSIIPGATWSDSWKGVDLPEERLMQANDVALAVISALKMSKSAVMEEIILRPQLGDL